MDADGKVEVKGRAPERRNEMNSNSKSAIFLTFGKEREMPEGMELQLHKGQLRYGTIRTVQTRRERATKITKMIYKSFQEKKCKPCANYRVLSFLSTLSR